MEYLFGSGKSVSSVADHAKKVVADLQVTLTEKSNRIKDLEVKSITVIC
jgi:hypothetical protein